MLTNPSHMAYIAISPILSVTFTLMNIVTIYVFWRKFHVATLSLIVIVNICACDIFVSLCSNTFYIVNLLHTVNSWSTGSISCKMFKFLTMLANVAQIYFLCILCADRRRRLMNYSSGQWHKRHGIVFVGIGWTAATVVCLPRLVLFDEGIGVSSHQNATVVSYACAPIELYDMKYIIATVTTFIVAYALPACYILYTLIRSQVFMWQRRKSIHLATTSNTVTKLNNKLALTFNLTGALFMAIWTPFFVLSIVDLTSGLLNSKDHKNVNFSLRCTLLILGSSKPFIYLICLDKFRNSFRCGNSSSNESSVIRSSKSNAANTNEIRITNDSVV